MVRLTLVAEPIRHFICGKVKMFICQMLVTGKQYRRELLLQQMKIPWELHIPTGNISITLEIPVGNGKVLLVIMALLSIPESPLVLATTASLFMVPGKAYQSLAIESSTFL